MPRRKHRTGRHGQAGFTLLELLVALTLLGLILAVVFGELRFSARAWDAADAKLDRNSEMLSVHAFLRQRLQQIHVEPRGRQRGDGDSPAVFDGESRSLTFLGTMPALISEGGFYEISLSSEAGEDGNNLFVSWRPFDPDGAAPVADNADNSRVLLRDIEGVHFSYFGQTSDAVAPQWWDAWPAHDTAPSLIRVAVLFADGDRRSWPELVVAPAVAAAVSRLP